MKIWSMLIVTAITLVPAAGRAQDFDRKTVEKMLKDGAKKLTSANAEEREEGAGYLLGYLPCSYRQQYLAVLLKALKDSSPKVRSTAAQTLEKVQATEAIPDLVTLLDDPDSSVQIRAAYALGGLGPAARSAEPALQKALERARSQDNSMVEGSLVNALDEVAGKQAPNRYSCP